MAWEDLVTWGDLVALAAVLGFGSERDGSILWCHAVGFVV